MMYLMPLAFIAFIVWAFYFNKGAEDEKMKAKGFIKITHDTKPDLGVIVQLQAKSGVIPNQKYASNGSSKASVMPETYVLFEVDDELIWVPQVSFYPILSFNQGAYYKPNLNPTKDLKFTYTKGDTKFKTLTKKSYRKGTRFESRGEW